MIRTDLHAERDYSDEHLEEQSQGQLPHGGVNIVAGGSIGQSIAAALEVAHVVIVTQLRGVQQATVIKQFRNELAGAHASVAVGECQQGCECGHHQNLQDWVVAQNSRLA